MIGILKPGKCHTALGHRSGIRLDQRTDKGWRLVHLGKIDANTKSFTYGQHTLSFNEAGDLFDLNYGLIGLFKCTLVRFHHLEFSGFLAAATASA